MRQKIRTAIRYDRTRLVLLLASLIALLVILVNVAPRALEVWFAYDYDVYRQMGRAVLQGTSPYGEHRFYPLPTVLWLFVPLALLPDWFRLLWVMGPIASILILFGRRGLPLFFFTPLWFVISDAMIDGWLLLPLASLLAARPLWAGVSALAVLIKPQYLFLPTAYLCVHWLIQRDWRNLITFAVTFTIVIVPSFILNPNWIGEMLAVLPQRANETLSIYPTLTASVWAWSALGGIGWLIFGAVTLSAFGLAWHAFRRGANPFALLLLLSLIFVIVLYAPSFIAVLPLLRNRKQIIIVVLISLGALLLDRVIGIFGGGYVFIPLIVLYFLAREPNQNQMPRVPN